MDKSLIQDVSDTAVWVAYYRAEESGRSDALFRDPLARRLVGERGEAIAASMKVTGRFTRWTVVIRTVIIDRFIERLVQSGEIDTVVNLGAGLDTRPYRMTGLPRDLHWIEVDYPKIIALKSEKLASETPVCRLARVELDLSDDGKRQAFLSEIAGRTGKALILTEGVIPYLTEKQVSELAQDLLARASFKFWITEYMSPTVYPHIRKSLQKDRRMENAPFQFFPADWIGFFGKQGWRPREIAYTGVVAAEPAVKRPAPFPWFVRAIMAFAKREAREKMTRMTGFLLLER